MTVREDDDYSTPAGLLLYNVLLPSRAQVRGLAHATWHEKHSSVGAQWWRGVMDSVNEASSPPATAFAECNARVGTRRPSAKP